MTDKEVAVSAELEKAYVLLSHLVSDYKLTAWDQDDLAKARQIILEAARLLAS